MKFGINLAVSLYVTINICKTKIKSYERKIKRNVYDDKVPKYGSQYVCLSEIVINFAFRTDENYHQQVFLEEG